MTKITMNPSISNSRSALTQQSSHNRETMRRQEAITKYNQTLDKFLVSLGDKKCVK